MGVDRRKTAGRAPDAGFLRASSIMVVAANLSSLVNFLFQWLAARLLAATEYGLLGALLAVVTVAAIPGQALQMVLARRAAAMLVAGDGKRARALFTQHLRIAGVIALVEATALVAVAPILVPALHLSGRGEILLAAAAGGALLLSFVGLGALQALQEFGRFGMSQLIISLWRLLGGGALAAFGMGVAGALTGALIGPISVLPWAFRRVSRRLGGRAAGASGVAARALIRDAIPILLTAGAFLALVHLDVPFAQACFGGQESPTGGIYNASATLARSILYVALPICTVTYARVSRAVARGSPHRPYLWKNLLMTLLLCAGGALILGGMPEEILRLYGGGEKYVQGVGLLRLMLVPMALLSVAAVFLHYHLALGRRHPAVVTPAAVVAAVLLYRGWHGEPEDLVRGLTVVSGALVAGNVICLVPGVGSWRRPTPPA